MGNSLGRRKKAKVMKIDGETFKLKTPVQVVDVVRDHPGHVLLDSEAVKHFGVRAKPLEPEQELKPKKIYFLVQLPKFEEINHHVVDDREKQPVTRRVRSSVHMNAKDRLDLLMLSRRTVSDLANSSMVSGGARLSSSRSNMPTQVKMRLPKAQVAKLMEESNDQAEVAEKIINLYMAADGGGDGLNERRKMRLGSVRENNPKARNEKRVSFVPPEHGEIRLNVDTEQ